LLLTKIGTNLLFSQHFCEDNMSNIPFEKQRLQVNLVEQIEREIASGRGVPGEILLAAIEQSAGLKLAAPLSEIVAKSSIPAVKRPGRPPNSKGREDFALEDVDNRYPTLLRKYEEEARNRRDMASAKGDALASAERTPSELADREILQDMKADFPGIDWLALRNKHSAWKNGRFHPADNHVDSEDFDAEIDRQFPAPQRRS
jgi:hypothetical protein